jgi:hypothetical protein
MSAAIYPTDPVYAGDTWPGIPSISIRPNGEIPAISVASAKLIFFKAEDGPQTPSLTLTSPDEITLVDAADWELDIPPVILDLAPGEWTFRFSTTAAGEPAIPEVITSGRFQYSGEQGEFDSGNLLPVDGWGGASFSSDGGVSVGISGEWWSLITEGAFWSCKRWVDGTLTLTWESLTSTLVPDLATWPAGITVTAVRTERAGTVRTWIVGTLQIL